jgi:hypothetical protein
VIGDTGTRFSATATLAEIYSGYALREFDNDQTRRIAGVEPRYGECSSDLLRRAKDNLQQRFAAVGTTERLDESLAVAAHTLGWSRHLAVSERYNVNDLTPGLEAIDRETRELITARNELDLELHAFANQLLDARLAELSP